MSTFANQLKEEIARIARKSGRSETFAIKKASAQHRADLAQIKRRLVALETAFARISKQSGSQPQLKTEKPVDRENVRFRQDGFITLRKKLGLSAHEMGTLLGVSGQSIYKWEQGKAKPQAKQLLAIVAARKLGKKQVRAKLGESQAGG